MFDVIKAWFSGKIVIVAVVVGSVLLASLGLMTFLYHDTSKQLYEQVDKNGTLVANNASLKLNIESLTQQLEDEKKRHEQLEATKQQIFDEYVKRQEELEKMKVDPVKKAQATKNPSAYEKEVQKALDDYQNRMNCITGNTVSCSRL